MITSAVGSSCTGSIKDNGDSVAMYLEQGAFSAIVGITGTWTGTITFKGTNDGVNYTAISGTPQPSGTAASTTTGNGQWRFSVGGITAIEAIASASMTGLASVTITSSAI